MKWKEENCSSDILSYVHLFRVELLTICGHLRWAAASSHCIINYKGFTRQKDLGITVCSNPFLVPFTFCVSFRVCFYFSLMCLLLLCLLVNATWEISSVIDHLKCLIVLKAIWDFCGSVTLFFKKMITRAACPHNLSVLL